MRKISFLLICLFAFASAGIAQKVKFFGELDFLNGVSPINVEFRYDSLVSIDKKDAQVFINSKKAGYEKKGLGGGEKWYQEWIGFRESLYEPMLLEDLNKNLPEGYEYGFFPEAKYTMVISTTSLINGAYKEFGYVSADIIFYENATKGEMAKITIEKAYGRASSMKYNGPEAWWKECYALIGRRLAGEFTKRVFEKK